MMKHRSHQEGQIAIATAIFLFMISSTVVLGLAVPVYREVKNSNDFTGTRESYYISEALNEDLTYRIKSGRTYPTTLTLAINEYSATGTVATLPGGKEIITTGNRQNALRRVRTFMTESPTGVAFNYGIQSGNGGFVLNNNAGVNGNVYANGNITGTNGAFITGEAIAANSLPISTDQNNSSPATPSYDLVFGNSTPTQDIAQSFQTSTTSPINKFQFYVKKTSTPGDETVRIVSDNAGTPSTNVISSGTLSASSVTTSYGWVDVVMTPNVLLTASTTYWVIIDGGINASRYYTIGANTTYPYGTALIGDYGGSWGNTSPSGLDTYFKIYLGGLTSTISGVVVGTGTTGDGWAHTVNNSTIRGSLYCQAGSGNNKACNTSRPDPVPQGFPLSDATISAWKEDTIGNVINGNQNILVSTSMGPAKIVGDLTINGNITLTLNGTLYVTGNINLSNGARIILSSSYGANSGVILADGRVSISNNATFSGSGQAGSYMLLVTTSDCPISTTCGGLNALQVGNNAGTVILNAQRGTAHISNNAGAKEVTAYKIVLDNNAVVTYESGLANVNFTTGPSGGFDISSWQEIQ